MAKVWRIKNFTGGISTGDKVGITGSFAFGQGLDFRTNIDRVSPNYAMVKDSGVAITGLPKFFAQYGTTYYAICSDGKIHSNASTWTSLRTVSGCTGQGLALFYESSAPGLYYSLTTALGKYADLSGSPSFNDAYQVLNSDTLWHPLKVFLNKLCIGNGNALATLDSAGTFTASVFTLPTGWKIKCLEVRGDFLYIGAWRGTAITDYEQGAIFTWDGTATTYNSAEFINESGVNALLNQNDTLYVWAGTRGNVYQFVNGQYVKLKKIPGIGVGKTAEVYPGAVTGFNGIFHFAGAGSTDSTTMYNGVYTWGQPEKNYPEVLNFDYPVSIGNVQGAALAVSAVYAASPTKLFTGWGYTNTITMSIADPCVVTLASHAFADGTPIRFTTTGALPTGITAGTYYYTRSTATNTFNLYDTAAHAITGGATGRVATTGTQSGTQTRSNYGIDLI